MEWSTILDILKWLIPAGSVGSIVVWYANRTTRELKNIKDSYDAYKLMYEDVKQTLQDEIEEKKHYGKPWANLKGHSLKFSAAVIIVNALSIMSCSTSKQLTQNQREITDSVVIKEIREVLPVIVPETQTQLVIPTTNLHNLPQGAAFTSKNGQASVKVTYDKDTVYVTAICDSLQLLCERRGKELVRIRNDTEQQIKETRKTAVKDIIKNFLYGLASGLVIGILITTILIIKLKRK